MTIPGHETATRRELDIHGRDVTIVQYSFGAENDYGDSPKNEDSRTTVTARVKYSQDASSSKMSMPSGEVVEAEATVYVKDTVTVDDTPPQTEFIIDGVTYITVRAADQDNGLIAVACRREG